ncbi:hypothetical protein M0R72_06375 [Candidatus Pacearchaeota archaeon]|jgi:hypothetical protein|nr:hypothetical protein [Candidatus Pacearchaeota archaeon]
MRPHKPKTRDTRRVPAETPTEIVIRSLWGIVREPGMTGAERAECLTFFVLSIVHEGFFERIDWRAVAAEGL